jgi:hypothetical protein
MRGSGSVRFTQHLGEDVARRLAARLGEALETVAFRASSRCSAATTARQSAPSKPSCRTPETGWCQCSQSRDERASQTTLGKRLLGTTRRSAALLIGVDAVHRHDLGSRWPLTTEAREAVAFAIESRRSRRPSPQTGLCVRASGPLSRRGIRSARKVDHPPPVRWRRPPERTFWRPRSGSPGW